MRPSVRRDLVAVVIGVLDTRSLVVDASPYESNASVLEGPPVERTMNRRRHSQLLPSKIARGREEKGLDSVTLDLDKGFETR